MTKTRIDASDLAVGCVVENDPRALGHALRLVQSIRWFGGELANAQVMVCVIDAVDDNARRAFEDHGADVRIVQSSHSRASKLLFFAEGLASGRELLMLLDCKTVVVQDPLPSMRRDVFQAAIAPVQTVTPEEFERAFVRNNLPVPPQDHVNAFSGTPTVLHCDPAVIVMPANIARELVPVWIEYNERLAGELDVSLSLALVHHPVPFAEAPPELHFHPDIVQLTPPDGYFAIDPAILHYHDELEADLPFTPFPFAQARVEAFNRRLREERNGPAPRIVPPRASPIRNVRPPAQVIVLGMHRSGTSALTALLHSMGFWAGEEWEFAPADEHNEAGYFEHLGVWSIDEAILIALGVTWSEVANVDLSQLPEVFDTRFRDRARELVRELDRHGSWVVKDPRLCLLFPFWRKILEHPLCVLMVRDPLSVARSLAARDGLSISSGIALWERYTRDALASTNGLPRVLVSHRDLIQDPAAAAHHLCEQLARLRPELAALRVPTAEELHAIIDPALVHHQPDPDAERRYLTPSQVELLATLRDQASARRLSTASNISA